LEVGSGQGKEKQGNLTKTRVYSTRGRCMKTKKSLGFQTTNFCVVFERIISHKHNRKKIVEAIKFTHQGI